MSDVLARICDVKRSDVVRRKALTPLARLEALAVEASPPRGFVSAIEATIAEGRLALIA